MGLMQYSVVEFYIIILAECAHEYAFSYQNLCNDVDNKTMTSYAT